MKFSSEIWILVYKYAINLDYLPKFFSLAGCVTYIAAFANLGKSLAGKMAIFTNLPAGEPKIYLATLFTIHMQCTYVSARNLHTFFIISSALASAASSFSMEKMTLLTRTVLTSRHPTFPMSYLRLQRQIGQSTDAHQVNRKQISKQWRHRKKRLGLPFHYFGLKIVMHHFLLHIREGRL